MVALVEKEVEPHLESLPEPVLRGNIKVFRRIQTSGHMSKAGQERAEEFIRDWQAELKRRGLQV